MIRETDRSLFFLCIRSVYDKYKNFREYTEK